MRHLLLFCSLAACTGENILEKQQNINPNIILAQTKIQSASVPFIFPGAVCSPLFLFPKLRKHHGIHDSSKNGSLEI